MKRNVIGVVLGIMLLPGILSAADWTDKVTLKGDLRFRNDTIWVEDSNARNRQRIRARIGIEAEPTDFLEFGFQLASGSTDPISTNQTLTDGFSTKDIRLDLAYADMYSENLPGINLIVGKIKNPYYRPGSAEMIWDGDLNPEGGVIKYAASNDQVEFFANVGGFWVTERRSDPDTMLFGGQAGLQVSSLTVGISYFDYMNIQGYAPVYDPEDSFGNTVDENGNYIYDYNLVEIFAEFNFDVDGFPVEFFGDFVKNTAEGVSGDLAWLVGTKIGKAKEPLSYGIRYLYRRVKEDAVLGAFADSDFVGGGTDAKGHEIGLDFQVLKNVMFAFTYFPNERRLTSGGQDFHRMFFDFNFKF